MVLNINDWSTQYIVKVALLITFSFVGTVKALFAVANMLPFLWPILVAIVCNAILPPMNMNYCMAITSLFTTADFSLIDDVHGGSAERKSHPNLFFLHRLQLNITQNVAYATI